MALYKTGICALYKQAICIGEMNYEYNKSFSIKDVCPGYKELTVANFLFDTPSIKLASGSWAANSVLDINKSYDSNTGILTITTTYSSQSPAKCKIYLLF